MKELRGAQVPREELDRVFGSCDQRFIDQRRQIGEVKAAQGSVYGAEDILLDLKSGSTGWAPAAFLRPRVEANCSEATVRPATVPAPHLLAGGGGVRAPYRKPGPGRKYGQTHVARTSKQ